MRFTLFTSNPFARLAPAPFEGHDLNPVLQDLGLAIHPPLLYLGYVGFSISFSFAIAALIEGRIDAAWARWVRPWTLLAWMFLTLGIAMGSYWAYYELGWGGWWFWDPVENAELHAVAGGDRAAAFGAGDGEAQRAQDLDHPARDPRLLALAARHLPRALGRAHVGAHLRHRSRRAASSSWSILVLFIGGALALFALRAPLLEPGGLFAPITREGALVLNNLFLVSACAAVFVGTLYPLALEALTGEKISVGAPFFNLTFGAADRPAADRPAVRPVAGLEARRPRRRRAAPAGAAAHRRHHRRGDLRHGRRRRADPGALRHRPRLVRHGRRR